MPTSQELLDDLRATIADISKLVEDQQARLATALATRDRGLRTLRSFCPHADLVEVEMPRLAGAPTWTPRDLSRFCLTCGLMEHGIPFRESGDPEYATIRYERLTAEPRAKLQETAFGKLMERLNAQGRFDEFDDQGAWIGGKDGGGEHDGTN